MQLQKSYTRKSSLSEVAVIVALHVLIWGAVIFGYARLRYLEGVGLYYNVFYVLVGFICFVFLCWRSRIIFSEFIILLLFMVIIVYPGAWSFSNNSLSLSAGGLVSGLLIVSSYFMAKVVVFYGTEKQVISTSFWFFVASYCFYAVVHGDVFAKGFFLGASHNLISATIIFLAVAVVVVFDNQRLLSASVLLVAFFICFALYTRSSIAVISLASVWWLLLRGGGRLNLALVFFVFFLGALSFNVYLSAFEETKFFISGLESARWDMWSGYVKSQNLKTFLFGIDLNAVKSLMDYNGNPHNSFIRFHSNFGIAGVLFLLLIFCIFVLRANIYFVGLLVFLLLRASTDSLIFPSILDFFLFVFVLVSLNLSKNRGFRFSRGNDLSTSS